MVPAVTFSDPILLDLNLDGVTFSEVHYLGWDLDEVRRAIKSQKQRVRYANNRERETERYRKYRAENPEVVRETQKCHIAANREKRAFIINRYITNREKVDLDFKLRRRVRRMVRRAAKGEMKKCSLQLLGCSIVEFREHLEGMFRDGMNWENYGFKGWHIDHIRPVSSFDLTDETQVKAVCHYTNLQPLWWQENLRKGKSHG